MMCMCLSMYLCDIPAFELRRRVQIIKSIKLIQFTANDWQNRPRRFENDRANRWRKLRAAVSAYKHPT